MLTDLIALLEPLAATHAIQLVSGAIVAGTVLLILPGDALIAPVFLVQRGIVLVLLCSHLPWQVVASSALASFAIALIYLITVLRLNHRQAPGHPPAARSTALLNHIPFRMLGAALALLFTSALVHRFGPATLPSLMTWIVVWLLVQCAFSVLLAPTALHTASGILAFADAGRILYALASPDPLLWGLWAACDVVVVLGAAHLYTSQTAVTVSTPPGPHDTSDGTAQDPPRPPSESLESLPSEDTGTPE